MHGSSFSVESSKKQKTQTLATPRPQRQWSAARRSRRNSVRTAFADPLRQPSTAVWSAGAAALTAGKLEKDGAAEGTAGERQKDAVIATDLATALLATALASAQRLHEVRRCQRVCAVTKMVKHVLSKPFTIRLGVPGPPRHRASGKTAGGRASGGEREGCGHGWQIRRRRASATDGERDRPRSRSAQAARASG